MSAAMLSLRCPRCDQPIDFGAADVRARRAACPSCKAGCDLVRERSTDAGPLRSFDELRLHADPSDPPGGIRVLATAGRTRHVQIANKNPFRLFHMILLGGATSVFAIALLIRLIDGSVTYLPFRIVVIILLAVVTQFVIRRRHDEVTIEGDWLTIRREGSLTPLKRTPLDYIEDIELAGLEGRRWLEVRWRSGTPTLLQIADSFARTDQDLTWLRDYLRAGLALAREGRGELPSPAGQAALPAPKR